MARNRQGWDQDGLAYMNNQQFINMILVGLSENSLDWFKGKFTGNHGFYMFLPSNIGGFRFQFSHHPIL